MACKTSSDCSRGQVCNDGVCESASGFAEEKETVTFAQKKHERSLAVQSELRQLDIYSQFLDDEINEAIKERDEEAEDIDFWGTVGAVGGGILGGIGGCLLGGPGGCVAGATAGATVGAGVGSGISRGVSDYLGDAETYGLTDTEMAMFDESDFKYLKEEFFDIRKEGEALQEDLDEYDDDQWKKHVMSTLSDTWTAFQVANTAAKVGSVISKLGEEVVEEAGSIVVDETLSMEEGGWYEQISNITESIQNPLQQQLIPPVPPQ